MTMPVWLFDSAHKQPRQAASIFNPCKAAIPRKARRSSRSAQEAT